MSEISDPWDEDFDTDFDIDIESIEYLYQLRHSCNVLGDSYVAKKLKIPTKRMVDLCHSDIHGSKQLKQFFEVSSEKFSKMVAEYEQEARQYQQHIQEIHAKNEYLINDLKQKREQFANIGTNKVKRRLNKLALTNPIAKAVRLALEIEDKNISAKGSYGTYKDRIYNQKTKLILDLCEFFKEQNWEYGTQESDTPPTSHIIYFEIPHCEQISWHFTPNDNNSIPNYNGEWDKKPNSTLDKLELVTKALLENRLSV